MNLGLGLTIDSCGGVMSTPAEQALGRAYYADDTATTYDGTSQSTLLPAGALPALDVADEFTALVHVNLNGETPNSFGRFLEAQDAGTNYGFSLRSLAAATNLYVLLQGASGRRLLNAGDCPMTADGWATIGIIVSASTVSAFSDASGIVPTNGGDVADRTLVGDATPAEQPRLARATTTAGSYQKFGCRHVALWQEALDLETAQAIHAHWTEAP